MGPQPGDMRREKAAAIFREATLLADRQKWDGASNRGYYAVYHAVVARFEDLMSEDSPSARFLRDKAPKPGRSGWAHDVVVTNVGLALGLTGSIAADLRRVAEVAQDCRIKADYSRDPIEPYEFEDVLAGLPDLLEALHVKVAA